MVWRLQILQKRIVFGKGSSLESFGNRRMNVGWGSGSASRSTPSFKGVGGAGPLVISYVGGHHSVGDAGVVVQPGGQELQKPTGRLALSVLDEVSEQLQAPPYGLMLLLVSAVGRILDGLHEPFFV